MDKKLSIAQLILQVAILGLLVVVVARSGGQAQFQQQSIGDWTTNFGAIEADVPTIQPTAYPGLLVEMKGLGNALELRNASSTPVFYVSAAGAVTYNTSTVCETCTQITGATAATTATPAFRIANAADVNDLLVVEKDATPVFIVGNAGAVTRSGADTLTGSIIQTGHHIVTGPTTAVTGTPVVRINAASDVNDLLAIAKDGTDELLVDNTGDLDMTNNIIRNIGNAGTDFDTSGGLTLAAGLIVGTKEQLNCTYTEVAANANSSLTVAASCYVYAVSTSVNADITLATTNAVTGTVLYIDQIGAGTLVITDTNLMSHDGAALSLGANDAALLLFDGAKWEALLELAGS